MINSLHHYSKARSLHYLSSEINSLVKNDLVIIKGVEAKTKTENLFPDFLYLLWLTKVKSKKKNFSLSDAEKKFQTRIVNDSILETKMNQKQFKIFFSYLFKNVFRDFLKQPKPKTLILLKENFLIHIKQIPFLMYNKNFFFTILFQHTTYLNIQMLIKFQTYSMPKKLFMAFFYKILVLEPIIWFKP
jgi:hypothetical protein